MIGHTILRIIVGTHPLTAVTRTDQRTPLFGSFVLRLLLPLLLIECRGADEATLEAAVAEVCDALSGSGVPLQSRSGYSPRAFYYKPGEYNTFWDARKGLIPIVGGARESGSVMLLEDVACSTERLGEMSRDLIRIFKQFGYDDACVMGHALEGNLHLIFNQSFSTAADLKRYEDLMQEICENVACID